MSLQERQEGVEKTLEAKADDVERHEQKIDEVELKLQSIESAIFGISEDAALRSKIEKNLNERQRELHEEERNAEVLLNELASLLALVNEGEKTNAESAAALDDLRAIGEDVGDAEKIVKERERWANTTKQKIDDLMQRLGGQKRLLEYKRVSGIGGYVFGDHSEQTSKRFVARQGTVKGYERGTCALVACVNILRMAGVKIEKDGKEREVEEGDIVGYIENIWPKKKLKKFRKEGGAGLEDMQRILQGFGIQSDIISAEDTTIETVAKAIAEGKGIILGVDSRKLWDQDGGEKYSDHVVTPIGVGVTYVDKQTGELGSPTDFWLTDSAEGDVVRWTNAKNKYFAGDSHLCPQMFTDAKGTNNHYSATELQNFIRSGMLVTRKCR